MSGGGGGSNCPIGNGVGRSRDGASFMVIVVPPVRVVVIVGVNSVGGGGDDDCPLADITTADADAGAYRSATTGAAVGAGITGNDASHSVGRAHAGDRWAVTSICSAFVKHQILSIASATLHSTLEPL